MPTVESAAISGTRKAAILLSLVGEDAAAHLLRNLPPDDLERITNEVANLGKVPQEMTLQVLEEYQQMMSAQDYIAVGGRDLAIRMLVKAFGEVRARSMVDQLTQSADSRSYSVDLLKKADSQHIARFLAGELTQTKALVLAHLDAKHASSVLMRLEPEMRADCVRRLAGLGHFSSDTVGKVASVLNRRLRAVGDQNRRAQNGVRNVADLMNRLDALVARDILETIEQDDSKLATSIRDLMFTFEDFVDVTDHDMRELMKSVDKKVLMVALKGASDELRSCFYRTMSSRAIELMKEDSEVMGPVRSREVAKAQSEIVGVARQLEAEGLIALKPEEGDDYIF
jgi:flagellar motor switch protein FliG